MTEQEKMVFRLLKDRKQWKERLRQNNGILAVPKMKRISSLNTRILYIEHSLRLRGYKIET